MEAIGGTVILGKQLGRTLGFPTANIVVPDNSPADDGVYAAWARRENGEVLGAVVSVGRRPTVERTGPRLLEVHILDTAEWLDLYGENLGVLLVASLRAEQRFENLGALKQQIGIDCGRARSVLTASSPPDGF